jgi:hypothetical protein
VLGAEAVADRLQAIGLRTGGEPVGQRDIVDARPVGLALGPLAPVEPDLGRIGEVGADLDEARPEVGVADVEVIDADTALLAKELKAHRLGLGGAVAGAHDPLKLLAGHDRHDPETALALSGLQIGTDMIELAVIPTRSVGLL